MNSASGPVGPKREIPNPRKAVLAAWLCLGALAACRFDQSPQSPYLPGSKDYAGDDWTHDGNGDGIADSVEKYAPACALSPGQCLQKARTLKDIPPGQLGLRAENMFVWMEDGPREPELGWSPSEAALRGYRLSSSDTDVVSVREGRLFPKKAGKARVSVSSPGFPPLDAEFQVRVVAGGTRLDSLRASDLELAPDASALPSISWYPPDASYKDYTLSIEPDSVAVAAGDTLRAVKPGRAKVIVIAADGGRKAGFIVIVSARRIAVSNLAADDLVVRLEDGPQSPRLHWEPDDATDKGYVLATRDSSVAVPFSGKIKPLAPGHAVFTATSHDGGFATEFKVTVLGKTDTVPDLDPKPDPDSITGISVSALSMRVGESKAPVLAWTPKEAKAPAYTLSSDDSTVAEAALSDSGPRLVGKGAGATRAVLRLASGLSASFIVTVADADVKLVSIQAPDFSLDLGAAPYVPAITFTPENATDQTYSLIAPDTAGSIRIEANKVVAVRGGKSPLRIVPNGNAAAALICSVTVKVRVKSVTARNDTLLPNGALKAAAERLTWDPPEATDKSFKLATKDTGIVRIGAGGTSYQSVGTGKAKVIVQALDGSGALDTFTVLVRIPITQIIAKDLTLPNTDSLVNPWFLFTFLPANATNKGWSFLYLDPGASPPPSSVVSIVDNWQLRAASPGKASLIAYSLDNHAIRDTFTVAVTQPVSGLSADIAAINLRVGDPDYQPEITVEPANATVRTWSLTSANPAIASIIGGTAIRAMRSGGTIVTAVSDDNPKATVALIVQVRQEPGR